MRLHSQSFVLLTACFFAAVNLDSSIVNGQAVEAGKLREDSQKLMQDGNFKEAFVGFQKLSHDSGADATKVTGDINNALNCIARLGNQKDFDEFVEKTVAAHENNWRVLQLIAQQYMSYQHYGFMVSGKFERGQHRGGGEAYHSTERDRVRSLQLMEQAKPLVMDELEKGTATDNDAGSFYYSFAWMMLANQGYHQAWRLQTLTDTSTLPDYEPGYGYYNSYSGTAGGRRRHARFLWLACGI